MIEWAGSSGAELLDEIRDFIDRHATLQNEVEYDMLAVWALHTYVFRVKRYTPYLLALSPMKGSGKSTLLDTLFMVCCRAYTVIDPAAAATAEHIDATAPTWLVDEIDGIWSKGGNDKQQLRTIINSGFQEGRKWPRKRKGGVIDYDVYCPKALAGIEDFSLPTTTRDRCISITLVKQTKEEAAKRHRLAERCKEQGRFLNSWASWWAETNNIRDWCAIANRSPLSTSSAASGTVEVLFAVAELAGGHWPETLNAASEDLLPEEDEDEKVVLLRDLREVFGSDTWMGSQAICSRLNNLDSIWVDYRGKGLTTTMLARLLKTLDKKTKPGPERHDSDTGTKQNRGYHRAAFVDLWHRWLA